MEGDQKIVERSKPPILVVGWGPVISFYSIVTFQDILPLHSFILKNRSDIIGISWIADRVLSLIDSQRRLIFIDPDAQIANNQQGYPLEIDPTETFDISSLEIEPVNCMDNKNEIRAFHKCSMAYNGILYVMGKQKISSMTVLNWKERIDQLIRAGMWKDALELAIQFHNVYIKNEIYY